MKRSKHPMKSLRAWVVMSCLWSMPLAPMVRAETVGDLTVMVYDGFTQPYQQIHLAAVEIGRVDEIMVKVGDRVEQGQLIARLDEGLQIAALKVAQIQTQATGELHAAQSEAELNDSRLTKLRELSENGMTRPDELVRAEADARIARARVASIEEQIAVRQAELERAKVQLQRRSVLAPASGVIAEVFMQPGEYISPGEPAIVELLVVHKLLGVFVVPAEDSYALSVGTRARVRLRSGGQMIESKITSITPKIDGGSGTVEVRVELPNENGLLLPGDGCTLQILNDLPESSVNAPAIAPRVGRFNLPNNLHPPQATSR
ncbi:Multidrug resistance protein MdtA precursor [Rubripirellula amarantea]|uniref:Multidrug resistance protein MdtA n=1 Tax=Rubripirellula amarantea TaxID=2527999 RepID=A0A5C5WH98_9BACT|nr:efflux RND transporter periplasmic adaptor subunit [Rubripirellula amarantea]TWT50166.1 Multidrug resistance protein MdtA precursor [Rubripirellula amarantea]